MTKKRASSGRSSFKKRSQPDDLLEIKPAKSRRASYPDEDGPSAEDTLDAVQDWANSVRARMTSLEHDAFIQISEWLLELDDILVGSQGEEDDED